MTDVFISYASANVAVATDLRDHLEEAGLTCWMAPRDIPAGAEYGAEIIKGLEHSRVFLLCLSEEANNSQHVAREVERAVNKNLPILTYQYKKVTLSKSMEYFLASTQWYIPDNNHPYDSLINTVKSMNKTTESSSEESLSDVISKLPKDGSTAVLNKKEQKISGKTCAVIAAALILCLAIVGLFLFQPWKSSKGKEKAVDINVGEEFTFGTMEYGDSSEVLSWTILDINEEDSTVLCLADRIVAFYPYDSAESGNRAQNGEQFFDESLLDSYTDAELGAFWGNSDWAASNIRTWLNSSDAVVSYQDMAPVEDGTTLYENAYDTQPGFLYFFTEEERQQLVSYDTSYTNLNGTMTSAEDRVFLLSEAEAQALVVDQNMMLATLPTQGAIDQEGTDIYASHAADGEAKTFWALRSCGDTPACTVLCAGTGLGHTEQFHSEYACSSLIGIRPAIVLPMSFFNE